MIAPRPVKIMMVQFLELNRCVDRCKMIPLIASDFRSDVKLSIFLSIFGLVSNQYAVVNVLKSGQCLKSQVPSST